MEEHYQSSLETSLESVWNKILSNLEQSLGQSVFKVWFNHFKPVNFSNKILKIEVSSRFVKQWLENKYYHQILKITREYLPEIKSIEFVVSNQWEVIKTRSNIIKKFNLINQQTLLDINPQTNLNPRYRFNNFVVGSSNELAFAAAQAVVRKPGSIHNPLFVYGPVGVGKTHLLQALGNEILKTLPQLKVKYTNTEQFTNELINSLKNKTIDEFKHKFREVDVLILDDVHFLSGKGKSQEELFHTFNFLYELGKQIVFSSDQPPKMIPDIEERLRSRFEGGLVIDIQPPDYEMRIAILKTKAQEKNIEFENWVYEFLAERVKRNIRELEGVLNLIIFKMNFLNGLTKEILENIIKEFSYEFYRKINSKKVLNIVAQHYGVKEESLIRKERRKELVEIRSIVIYFLREICQTTYSNIANLFKKDHTTILYAYEKVVKRMSEDVNFRKEIEMLRSKIIESS